MVVHDLLRLVVNLVSATTLLGHFSNALSPSVFEYTYLLFWNSFWTLCPVIAIGLFDRVVGVYTAQPTSDARIYLPLDEKALMAIPALYRYGREGKWFGGKLFAVFMLEGVVQVG